MAARPWRKNSNAPQAANRWGVRRGRARAQARLRPRQRLVRLFRLRRRRKARLPRALVLLHVRALRRRVPALPRREAVVQRRDEVCFVLVQLPKVWSARHHLPLQRQIHQLMRGELLSEVLQGKRLQGGAAELGGRAEESAELSKRGRRDTQGAGRTAPR
jgi:hypothetical protein